MSILFHSGKRLQKLRITAGYDIDELADGLKIESSTLENWEKEGVPKEFKKKCIYYFDIASNIFIQKIETEIELEILIGINLFERDFHKEAINTRLKENKQKKSPFLNLSNLNLKSIPPEIFEFSWLTELDLSDNQLKNLPNQILLLNKLEKLNLNDNLFLYISGILNSISTVKILNFEGNPLNLQPELKKTKKSLNTYKNFGSICILST